MKRFLMMTAVAVSFALPVLAHDGVHVMDPYARASTGMSQSGAAFMRIVNHAATDKRIVAAESDVAQRVELHTHKEDANGVMRMIEVEEGFVIPANGEHVLARGGDHVMFLGLNRPLNHGDQVNVTLIFEDGEKVDVVIPVDLERKADEAAPMGHNHKGHTH
jgi:periplasmic copper chaperone A